MWRTVGPEAECVARYAASVQDGYPDKELLSIAREGRRLIRHYGCLYPALMGVQEEIRLLAPQLEYSSENNASFPAQYPEVVGIIDRWIRVEYPNGAGRPRNSRITEQSQTSGQFRSYFRKTAERCARPTDVRVSRPCDLFGYTRRRDAHYYDAQ